VIHGIDSGLAIPRRLGVGRIPDQRLHIWGINASIDDGGSELPIGNHLREVPAELVHDIRRGRLVVFLHMLLVDGDPGDLVEIDAVLRRKDSTDPDAGGDGIAPYSDLLSLEILR